MELCGDRFALLVADACTLNRGPYEGKQSTDGSAPAGCGQREA